MKQLYFLTLTIIIVSCGGSKITSNKIIPSESSYQEVGADSGLCIFGSKRAAQSEITTRADCILRDGAFSPDIDDIEDYSRSESL